MADVGAGFSSVSIKPLIWKLLADVGLGAAYAGCRRQRFAEPGAPRKEAPRMDAGLKVPNSSFRTGADAKNALTVPPSRK
jgi:hypothetical protein